MRSRPQLKFVEYLAALMLFTTMILQTRYNLLILALLFLSSCNEEKNTVKINLTVQNSPGLQLVSLVGKDYGQPPLLLDTATIKAGNSKSSFETAFSSPGIYSLTFGKDGRYILFSNDEPVIDLTVNWNNFSEYSISSPASVSLKNMLLGFNGYLRTIDSLRLDTLQKYSDSIRNITQTQIAGKRNEAKQFLTQFTDTTQNPAVAVYALGILQQQQNDSVVMKPLIAKLISRFPNDPTILTLNQDYQAWLKKQVIVPITKPDTLPALPDSAK